MTSPILELKDVDKYYGALHATRAVSLTVEHGEIHALTMKTLTPEEYKNSQK